MNFINRRRELDSLNAEYSRVGSSFVVIYGRRRLGKTSLIREFMKDKPGVVYFLADKSSEAVTINLFKDVIDRSAEHQNLAGIYFSNWDQLFDHFLREYTGIHRPILVIDEFQYLVWSNKAFPSILQRIWDQQLITENIMLIICGSSVSMMLSEALNYNSPLYGRRTGQIQLAPLDFFSFHEFFPAVKPVDLAEIYGLTGGVPKYTSFFSGKKSLIHQIKESYLNVDHFLNQEARFLLSEEIHEPLNYFSILKSIAAGNHTMAGISGDLKVAAQKLSPYLQTLQQVGLVTRMVPVTEDAPHKSKKGLYRISDYYLRFWFRYVFPYQSDIALGNTGWLLDKIRNEYIHYMGPVFEDICRQTAVRLFPGMYTKIGSWWDKHSEADVVGLNPETKTILIGECKWTNKPVGSEMVDELLEKSTLINPGFHPMLTRFIIFSKSGFTKGLVQNKPDHFTLIDFQSMEFSDYDTSIHLF